MSLRTVIIKPIKTLPTYLALQSKELPPYLLPSEVLLVQPEDGLLTVGQLVARLLERGGDHRRATEDDADVLAAVDGGERLELLLPRGAPRLERQVRLARVRVARRLCGSRLVIGAVSWTITAY